MRKSPSCIFYEVSELSRRKLLPTYAHYSSPDNAIGLVGRQLDAVGRKHFLITSKVYVDQMLCAIFINWILIQTETCIMNIKIIKIAVENANLCRKNMRYAHFSQICEKCGNMRNMRQSHIHVKLTCLTTSKVKINYTDIAVWQSNLLHRYRNSRAIWNHTVLPATRQRWHSCPYPSRSWYSIKRPRRNARLSWPSWLVTYRDGIPARRRSPIPVLTEPDVR